MDIFFKKAPDLIDEKNIFCTGDLEDKSMSYVESTRELSVDDINAYLKTIVSGKKYDMECELGTICGEGDCIVSFEELKTMIDEGGYNFVSANCFNKEMISIVYQKFSKEYSRKF